MIMTQKHVHSEVIKAWADGAKIQTRSSVSEGWEDIDTPQWRDNFQYRVKPETTVISYRVGLFKSTNTYSVDIVSPEERESVVEQDSSFVKWIEQRKYVGVEQ